MGIEWRDDAEEPTLSCSGEIGPMECAELHRELSDRLTAGTRLCIDLSEVESCGTMLVQLIYSATERTGQGPSNFQVINAPNVVQEAYQRVGLSLAGM